MIPHIATAPLSSSTNRHCHQRSVRGDIDNKVANRCIDAINALSHHSIIPSVEYPRVSLSSKMAKPLPLSTSVHIQRHIRSMCTRYRRLSGVCHDDSGDVADPSIINSFGLPLVGSHFNSLPGRGDGYGVTPSPLAIISDRVSLPAAAGTADLLSLLPGDVATRYSDPRSLLVPPAAKLNASHCFMVGHEEYHSLIRRMNSLGMIHFTREPMAINGIFGVAKGPDKMRLILDARPANAMFVEPPHVKLPGPDHIAQLSIPIGQSLHVGKVDIDNFYHRLRMPREWWPFFALPGVRAGSVGVGGGGGGREWEEDSFIYPCLTTLPMGFSHSVYLAQILHEHLIDTRTSIRRCDRIDSGDGAVVDRTRFAVYIDDLMLFDIDSERLRSLQHHYCGVMESVGLSPKLDKTVYPTGAAGRTECLGVMVDGAKGLVGVDPRKLCALVAATRDVIRRGRSTGHAISQLIGRWTWAMLVNRPSLSIFSAVYRYIIISERRCYGLWPSVVRELEMAMAIAPLLVTSIRRQWWQRVVVTDASEIAQGIVMRHVDCDMNEFIASAFDSNTRMATERCIDWIQRSSWTTIASRRWDRSEHINCLELRAVLTAIRWSIFHRDAFGARLLLLSDSQVTIGALRKGRSSSFGLLVVLRAIAALLLSSGTAIDIRWVPSNVNPADAPSRIVA